MKRKLLVWLLFVSTVALASCGVKNAAENAVSKVIQKEKPVDVIKDLQVNLVDSIKSTALGKTDVAGKSNIWLSVLTPWGKGNIWLAMNFESVWYTGNMNLVFTWDFDLRLPQVLTWTFSWKLDVISTLPKSYLKLEDFVIKSSDPQLMMYNSMVTMFKWKWFYVENSPESQKLTKVLSNLSLKDELSKYSVLKVKKELSKYNYEVSLDKKNIATIVYDISKKVNPDFTGTVADIEKELGSGDIVWVIKIEDNKKYFVFSGNILEPKTNNNGLFNDRVMDNNLSSDSQTTGSVEDKFNKIPLVVKFTKDKLYFALDGKRFVIDLDKSGDNFKGYISYQDNQLNEFKVDLNGKLNAEDFDLFATFEQNWVKVDFKMTWKYKAIKTIDVKIPEDAVSLQDLQGNLGR